MKRLYDLIWFAHTVLLALLALVLLVAQCCLAGGFRWFLLLLGLMAAGSVTLACSAWREYKQGK